MLATQSNSKYQLEYAAPHGNSYLPYPQPGIPCIPKPIYDADI